MSLATLRGKSPTYLHPSPTKNRNGAVAWAVWLGCTTSIRLAEEWQVQELWARRLLARAALCGFIQAVRFGVYRCRRPPKGQTP